MQELRLLFGSKHNVGITTTWQRYSSVRMTFFLIHKKIKQNPYINLFFRNLHIN